MIKKLTVFSRKQKKFSIFKKHIFMPKYALIFNKKFLLKISILQKWKRRILLVFKKRQPAFLKIEKKRRVILAFYLKLGKNRYKYKKHNFKICTIGRFDLYICKSREVARAIKGGSYFINMRKLVHANRN